ncbi:MAG: transglycosylase SLT domain-containing protein [Pseudomonadota bacterium]
MTLRVFYVAVVLAALGSCSSTPDGPPRAQDDICAIFAERPTWRNAAQKAALRWNTPVELKMAIIWRESSFRAAVRPPRRYALGIVPLGRPSSALGYAQAIDGTWDWYQDETGQSSADRTEFADAVDFVGWYVAKTERVNSVGRYDAFNHYLAYHEGHAGHRRGGWQQKSWLKRAASQVAEQTARYRGQLSRCPV